MRGARTRSLIDGRTGYTHAHEKGTHTIAMAAIVHASISCTSIPFDICPMIWRQIKEQSWRGITVWRITTPRGSCNGRLTRKYYSGHRSRATPPMEESVTNWWCCYSTREMQTTFGLIIDKIFSYFTNDYISYSCHVVYSFVGVAPKISISSELIINDLRIDIFYNHLCWRIPLFLKKNIVNNYFNNIPIEKKNN